MRIPTEFRRKKKYLGEWSPSSGNGLVQPVNITR